MLRDTTGGGGGGGGGKGGAGKGKSKGPAIADNPLLRALCDVRIFFKC